MTKPLDDELEKAAKRHCWPRDSLASVYEAGFESGASFERERLLPLIKSLCKEIIVETKLKSMGIELSNTNEENK